MDVYKFPENFKWGSATSAHQIEGGNHNDWSEWEISKLRVENLKAKGLKPEDFVSGKACDSYNRYQEDFDIAKKLNQNIHRFSVEWSRLEPEEGRFDEKAMQHYIDVVKALKDRGIEPMITLWHFTNPVWFAKKGGWSNPKSPELFLRFIKVVVKALKGENVRLWITFNEAFTIYAAFTKLNATWPSQDRGILSFFKTRKNMTKAHVLAYKEIKKMHDQSPVDFSGEVQPRISKEVELWDPNSTSHNVMVGITENNVYVPETKNFLTTRYRRAYRQLRNFYFFKKNVPYYDFIGLNYYHMSRKPKFNEINEIVPRQEINKDMNWELYPKGIYHVLEDLKKFKRPIYITENGIADAKDLVREKFIKEHLKWIWQAIQDGVDVQGYMYWSLLDNFEWAHGYKPKFGLVEVDFNTFERHIRPSALEYAKICLTNQLRID